MRIKDKIENIDYSENEKFFQNRGSKYKDDNPYSVTMYQDDCPDLVKKRNEKEVSRLMPYLNLNSRSVILDIACGIGRWADAVETDITSYTGIDFSQSLIEIANKRNTHDNYSFMVSDLSNANDAFFEDNKNHFNTVLMIGVLVYINDEDLPVLLSRIEESVSDDCVICIREPMGIDNRLTLKDFYSEELKDNYNAIYRTREEYRALFEKPFLERGFKIKDEGFLFEDDELNNRKETAQYFYILER